MTTPPSATEPSERPAPPITDELRARARQQPGTWMYNIDPAFDPAGEVPVWGIIGGWQIDQRGELVQYWHNPKYQPSATAMGVPAPENPAEAALQRAATGHGSEHELLDALRDAELLVFAHPEHPGLYIEPGADGPGTITACTSTRHVPSAWPGWLTVTGRQLAAAAPGHLLRINPGTTVSVTLPLGDLSATGDTGPEPANR
ncbi:type VII secretion system-associated protein [Kitasatospora acidiphila]|uniref:type VII secretion system-associated protein n=1 Tax=Kitasatospora acidiphila TaxID=2567942 RepID=UPI003C757663